MNMKKLLCALLAALLAMSAAALAEDAEFEAQLAEKDARIAELEAQVELYRPYYDMQIVAEYGEDGVIWRSDAVAMYDQQVSMYTNSGYSIAGYEDYIRQDVVQAMVEEAVLKDKAAELGLDQLDEAAQADLAAQAEEMLGQYVTSYRSYFTADGMTDEEIDDATRAFLADNGLTSEALLEDLKDSLVHERLYDHVTADVVLTDEELRAAYDAKLAEDEAAYASDDRAYNSARNAGEVITWNPEGYRAVKQVLIAFDDDQTQRLNDLNDTLDSLSDELAAAQGTLDADTAAADAAEAAAHAIEDAAEAVEDAAEAAEAADEGDAEAAAQADEAAVEAETEAVAEAEIAQAEAEEAEAAAEGGAEAEAAEGETAEAEADDGDEPVVPEPRSAEAIQADIDAVNAELDALYGELMPTAQQVADAFAAGTPIEDLIAQYGEDPGMTREPASLIGYAVSENNQTWDPAFQQAAMSIEAPGQLSAPARGSYGLYIVYYMNDVTPGAVAFEDIAEALRADAEAEKISAAWNDAVGAWMEAAAPVYHVERMK